jgi:hypothetical protein
LQFAEAKQHYSHGKFWQVNVRAVLAAYRIRKCGTTDSGTRITNILGYGFSYNCSLEAQAGGQFDWCSTLARTVIHGDISWTTKPVIPFDTACAMETYGRYWLGFVETKLAVSSPWQGGVASIMLL